MQYSPFMLTLPAALLLSLTPHAHAAGYYTSDVGVRAFSRGGAYVAGANDLLAMWYNPAALTRVKDGLLTVDVAGVSQWSRFDRADYPGEGPADADGNPTDLINPAVENQSGAYLIPHIGAAWDFGLPDTSFAVGFYPPYAPDVSYAADGPQRYSLTDSLVIQTFTGVSAAHRLWDRLSVGVGASWNVLVVEQELKINIPFDTENPTAVEDPKYDVAFGVRGKDRGALAWNLGLLYEPPSNRWAVGLMMQAPTRFEAKGHMRADFSDNFFRTDENLGVIDADTARDNNISFAVSMPLILKAGVLVRPIDNLEIELAGVWEGWSVNQEIVVTDVNMTVPVDKENPLGAALGLEDIQVTDDIVLPAGHRDAWSLRLGGEWWPDDAWAVRAGMFYEISAVPETSMGVGLMDGNKAGYGLGGTWQAHKRIGLDLGMMQTFVPKQTLENSELKSIMLNWQTGEMIDGRPIGDGTIQGRNLMIGGGVNYAFGKHPERTVKLGHAPKG